MALVWGSAAGYNDHRVRGDFSAIGECLSKDPSERPATKAKMPSSKRFVIRLWAEPRDPEKEYEKHKQSEAWTSDEEERLRELIISNVSVFDIATDLDRTVLAVMARAQALRIPRGRSRFRVKAKGK